MTLHILTAIGLNNLPLPLVFWLFVCIKDMDDEIWRMKAADVTLETSTLKGAIFVYFI